MAHATFKAENGYVPPLASPTSFNEHIFARKFFAPLPMPSLADKLAAKDYVKARLGDDVSPRRGVGRRRRRRALCGEAARRTVRP